MACTISNNFKEWKSIALWKSDLLYNRIGYPNTNTTKLDRDTQRNPPPQGLFKLNFDGSKAINGRTGDGFCIRNHHGDIISLSSVNCNNSSIMLAKAIDFREGVKDARRLGLERIVIQGDNLAVINAARGVWHVPWEIRITMEDILVNLDQF